MAEKRQRSSPTGNTPHRPLKRVPLRAGRVPLSTRRLTFAEENSQDFAAEQSSVELHVPRALLGGTLTDEKTKTLLTFLLLNRPATKSEAFWSSAAEFVQKVGKRSVRRSGKSMQ